MQNADDASTNAGVTQTKRIYCREWRVQHRTIRATVSLPRLQLVNKERRPIFECPVCFSCNDKVPICFWCKSTSPESTAAFWSSMPKQRTISAPVHMSYASANYLPKPTGQTMAPVAVDTAGTGARVGADSQSTEKTVAGVVYNQPCQRSFVPPPAPISASVVPLNCSTLNRAASARSVLLRRRSSYNPKTSTVTTCTTRPFSEERNPDTTPNSSNSLHRRQGQRLRLRLGRVDDFGRQRITTTTTTTDILQSPQQQQQQEDHGRRYHSLPLRRKGHLLRTTAGMIVKKTRLSALFRKDAVPILEATTIEPSPHAYSRQLEKENFNSNFDHHRYRSSSKRSRRPTVMSTIPDSIISPAPQNVPLLYSPPTSPVISVPPTTTNTHDSDYYYAIPTPPSFLSPFWYRPDQYGNLPSSPTATSSSSGQTSLRNMNMMTDQPDQPGRPSLHTYTRSDPFPTTFPRQQGSSRTWKTKMGGFFRTSINVVSGRHSR